MKRIEDIEQMEIADLEKISNDRSVCVPSDLLAETEDLVDSLELSERLLAAEAGTAEGAEAAGTMVRKTRWLPAFGAAAAVALLLGIGLSLRPVDKELVDTYDDPLLAYAEFERAMMKISGGVQAGVAGIQKSNDCIEMPVEILNRNINR